MKTAWFKSSYSSNEGGNCLEVSFEWRKSSYSGSEGGDCVEVAYDWHKSSYSGSEGGNCVEVAAHPAAVHVRDSKAAPVGPVLTVSPASWAAFVGLTRDA
ncbi:DUF397 domain-containing protein [Streptomyces sp. NPDC046985]|uniref:DUF397 domain-containing protein n=1 Tax=Streptomyces sp. NPDC046985 TaxID=3155377 RepID=UPI0033C91CAE